jgi:hypothetical protein
MPFADIDVREWSLLVGYPCGSLSTVGELDAESDGLSATVSAEHSGPEGQTEQEESVTQSSQQPTALSASDSDADWVNRYLLLREESEDPVDCKVVALSLAEFGDR